MALRPEFADGEYSIANDPVNIDKHRNSKIMALDKYRAYLQSYSVNRTDYINAVILPVSIKIAIPKYKSEYFRNKVICILKGRHQKIDVG